EAYEEASLIRNWRMVFTFEVADAVLVDYLDYH
ncbi:MAG: peptidase, partial [Betaproteobacteria bacterium]|nr:peptidase [Betaproteobacteria bacterium]